MNKEMAKQYYCGNNELDPRVLSSHSVFGTSSECFKKGYGLGLNQHIQDEREFVQKWGGEYKPHVKQKLYYGDAKQIPQGYDARETLNQSMGRGFALGSVSKAKKLRSASKSTDKPPPTTSPQTAQKHPETKPIRLPIRRS